MKFIFTADWHVKLYSDRMTTNFGLPLKLHEIYSVIHDMCDYAKEHGIKYMIIGGDTNDLKSIIHTTSFVLLKRILLSYKDDIKFIFVDGNHDKASKISKQGEIESETAIELLQVDGVIDIVTKPTVIGNITMIPYSNNLVDNIKNCDPNKILISHFGVDEATLSNGLSIKANVKLKDLKKFELVLLGHYHKPQQIDNLYYVGNPIQVKKDEKNEEKRFLVVDSNTLEVESILTKGYRKFFEFTIKEKSDMQLVKEQALELKRDGNYVTIINEMQEKIKTDNDQNIVIINNYNEQNQIRGITTAMAIEDQMKKYLEIKGIPVEQYTEYITLGTKILQEEIKK